MTHRPALRAGSTADTTPDHPNRFHTDQGRHAPPPGVVAWQPGPDRNGLPR